ncbi:MAG: LPS-assembly protein LptD [Betaproteobacteria bacterium]|nr:MAG: LPS-assembly protein LptD [Betaproteobacteria bacterium]
MPFRFALLALIAAAPALAQQPSVEEASPTTIDAERIEGVGDLEVTARGNAEIRRDDVTIFGDVLRRNSEFGTVQGEGGVRLQLGVDRFFGPRLEYNTLDETGVFESPGFQLQRDLPARGKAEVLEFRGKDRYRLKGASFTTCRPGQDDWMLEASQIDLDYGTEEGEARSPRLRFFGVPILGFPFASFPLENRRRSGILAPYYSQTSNRGFEFGVPYYWNIAPERDATITPVLMTKRGLQLKNQFRYLEAPYAGELRLEYLPDDKQFGRRRTGVSLQHAQTFRPGLTGQIDFNRVSDDRYFVDLASQVRQVSIGNLQQDGYVNYSGSLGSLPYSAQARVQKFQTLQDPLAPITPPYHRVPQLTFSTGMNDVAGLLDAALPAEYVHFTHRTLVYGSRTSLNPTLAMPFLSPGWFLTPKLGLRQVSYSLERAALGQEASPHVQIPWFSADTGLVFDREARFFGDPLTQTLEPRLFYVYVPYRNQDQLPLFDTSLADFNFPQLFTENRFGGGDRFGDADQVTLALTSRFLRTGQEAFRATVGQRYYFKDERVGLPGAPLRTSLESDVLGSVGGRLFRHWTFDATTQYNRHEQRAERYTTALRYNPEVAKVLNASYRFSRGTIRQIDLSAQWPVAAGWYAVGRYNYSFLDKRLLEGLAGFEYNAGCWAFRAVMQRVQAATQVSSTGFFFQLEFNGVGQVGTDDVVKLLSRSVPGYSVSNPRDPALAPPSARAKLPFEQVF